MSDIEDSKPHLRKLIHAYFTYNSPPVNVPAILNIFTSDFTAQYPSGTFKTHESYRKHVTKTAKIANALFRESVVSADPSSSIDANLRVAENTGEADAIVDWKYEYTWRIFGVKGIKQGHNKFVFEQEAKGTSSKDDYGGWRIKFVSTQVGGREE